MKGEEKLWTILNDKLETLRASSRLPEAVRVAETLLELAKRTFGDDDNSLALSYEKLGTLLDQSGDRVKAKPYLLKAHGVLEKQSHPINACSTDLRVDWLSCAIISANKKKRFVT